MPFTYYVATKDNKVYQIDNVTAITISSPLISNGLYRDSPPVVVGGASAIIGATVLSVVGGSSQTIGSGTDSIVAPSSVIQDDAFTHVVPRYENGPVGIVFFTTTNGIAPTPTGASFTTTPPTVPAGNFYVVATDCFWMLDEIQGVFNKAPQGWVP